jgi:Putative Flp pilus-assembly TadE/G-like
MVVAAVMILMFLSMTALAIDYGMVKTAKAEAQRAMDGSALAGASAFIDPDPTFNRDSAAKVRAKEIAVQHTVHRVLVDTSAAHLAVTVDLAAQKVTATYTVPPISLWFARRFGSPTMGLIATAAAHVENTNSSVCMKPVAIPDAWNNPQAAEDINGDHSWNYTDTPGRGHTDGVWDEGETEPWTFDPAQGDTYDSTSTGWGTGYRNGYGVAPTTLKNKDYGRQIFVQAFTSNNGNNDDNGDGTVPSYYYSWGDDGADNSAESLHDRILAACEPGEVQHVYAASNGAKQKKVGDAWDELINRDPDAYWDNATNTVKDSNKGANWLTQSDRVVVVGLYNPGVYSNCSSCNIISFNNLARIFLDKRPCAGNGACKQPLTAHFLGLVGGGGENGNPSGSLVKKLVLIK